MVTALSILQSAKRIVVKTGSALIADETGARQDWLTTLADDLITLRQRGLDVILVTSGAVALGRSAFSANFAGRIEQKQAAAAVGQPRLMDAMAKAFAPHGVTVGQALLTLDDTEDRRRWLNARATMDTLLEAGILPVINENDTVATDEIRYGDNDRLAARVAQMTGADALILLSDIDGLYTADPRKTPNAEHIAHLDTLLPEHDAMASGANADAGVGSGGMATKLAAARIAHSAGCSTIITIGDRPRPLLALEHGSRATVISARTTPRKAREAWLHGHLKPEGALHIDAGATKALNDGASLLPVGVVSVDGMFKRGAAVAIHGADETIIAHGITAYNSDDIARVAGLKSEDVESVLGYRGRPAIIHRDDMIKI